MAVQVHDCEILVPGTFLANVDDDELVLGKIVVVHSHGRFRTADITKIGPTWVQLEYRSSTGHVSKPRRRREEIYRTCWANDDNYAGVVRQRSSRGGQHLEV